MCVFVAGKENRLNGQMQAEQKCKKFFTFITRL